ncbi:trypsin-like serine peptidase [Pseudarthrobacter sp. TAF60_1]|uniref:trypsin-like serine peptidase n=1 Tax=Pseudarthrobacter sp. TAF60_1 TaxID=3233071 RepID=UPI003F94BAD0
MTRTRSLAASLLSLSAAAMLALVGAGTANAAPAPSEDKTAPVVASARVDSTGAAEYWTADRMRAAIPGDALAGAASKRLATPTEAVAKGTNTKVKPSTASKTNSSSPKFAREAPPVDHIGKVFFTMGGFNYVCSGNAVASANRSTVATAGHCVSEGPGAFVTNFAFVPAYDNGKEPYGKWTAKALYTTPQWQQKGDIAFDTGFAVMDPNADGDLLTDVVGGSGVAFGVERGLQYTAYGYPASAPYNGEQLWSCQGTGSNDTKHPEFNTQGIPCTMTGGSSGGPWFLSSGLQNSINSYGYNDGNVMYAPYWGEVIKATYDIAQAA